MKNSLNRSNVSPKDKIIFIYDYENIKSDGTVYTVEMAGIPNFSFGYPS